MCIGKHKISHLVIICYIFEIIYSGQDLISIYSKEHKYGVFE